MWLSGGFWINIFRYCSDIRPLQCKHYLVVGSIHPPQKTTGILPALLFKGTETDIFSGGLLFCLSHRPHQLNYNVAICHCLALLSPVKHRRTRQGQTGLSVCINFFLIKTLEIFEFLLLVPRSLYELIVLENERIYYNFVSRLGCFSPIYIYFFFYFICSNFFGDI